LSKEGTDGGELSMLLIGIQLLRKPFGSTAYRREAQFYPIAGEYVLSRSTRLTTKLSQALR
jgi:hypothetical protein